MWFFWCHRTHSPGYLSGVQPVSRCASSQRRSSKTFGPISLSGESRRHRAPCWVVDGVRCDRGVLAISLQEWPLAVRWHYHRSASRVSPSCGKPTPEWAALGERIPVTAEAGLQIPGYGRRGGHKIGSPETSFEGCLGLAVIAISCVRSRTDRSRFSGISLLPGR